CTDTRPFATLICLESYAPHPDRHSFPTRRSSDLGADRGVETGVPAPLSAQRCGDQTAGGVPGDLRGDRRRRHSGHRRGPASNVRSEEHTSELQSRENLVCRLLLEKKKKKK